MSDRGVELEGGSRVMLEGAGGVEYSTAGAGGLVVHGTTLLPEVAARGVAVVVHGWTGHRDRNVVPVIAGMLRDAGLVSHRITLGHSGIADGEDAITRHGVFERDRLDHATEDVRAVLGLLDAGTIAGGGLPLVLVGHSRGGSQVIRIAARAEREGWSVRPVGVVALAAPAAHTRFPERERLELAERGYVERAVSRAEGGRVRMGPSWFAHRFDASGELSGVDVFGGDCGDVRCPVLAVHGAADDAVAMEEAERVAGYFEGTDAGFEGVVIGGADHNFSARGVVWEGVSYDEATVGALRAAVFGFLDRVLGSD